MKLKAAYRYEIADFKKYAAIFYLVLFIFYLVIISFSGISWHSYNAVNSSINNTAITHPGIRYTIGDRRFSGLEFITMIFIFFIGYYALRNTFQTLLHNSISRKTIYISQYYTFFTIVLIMSASCEILITIAKVILTSFATRTYWTTLYENVYKISTDGIGSIPFHLVNFLYNTSLFLFMIALGYLVSLIYYRISRPWKIAVNSVLIISIVMIWPAVNTYTNNELGKSISDIFKELLGISAQQPVRAMLTFILCFAVLSGCSWLLIQKTTVKD